jgi:hypothetical protein
LAESSIGSVTRIRDAIATSGSIVDPVLSRDGRTLIFASTRDGGLQLYQSEADWVVSRLSVSTAHLDRFGRAKWWVPIGLSILLIVIARVTRRTTSVVSSRAPTKTSKQTQAVSKSDAISAPVHRSAPPVNPLASWQIASQETKSALVRATESRRVDSSDRRATAARATPVKQPPKELASSGRRSGRRLAGLFTLAALVSFGVWQRDRWLPPAIEFTPSEWSQFHQFRDIAATTRAELTAVARVSTSRMTAPEPQAVSVESTTLRQTARWPSDLTVVRAPAPLFISPEKIPDLTNIAKAAIATRATTIGPTSRAERGFVEYN